MVSKPQGVAGRRRVHYRRGPFANITRARMPTAHNTGKSSPRSQVSTYRPRRAPPHSVSLIDSAAGQRKNKSLGLISYVEIGFECAKFRPPHCVSVCSRLGRSPYENAVSINSGRIWFCRGFFVRI